MRTGSPRNALFKGRNQREYTWFAITDSLPLISANAERAASQIIEACRRGAARLVIGWPAQAAIMMNELFPEAMATLSAPSSACYPRRGEIIRMLFITGLKAKLLSRDPGSLASAKKAPFSTIKSRLEKPYTRCL